MPTAITSGFQQALLVAAIFLLTAAIIGVRAANSPGESSETDDERESVPV
ncbi:MAG: hypothetical protein J2P17_28225 [Mycobacterium sp.]|nr:hypothetical protein [Mycobacterium sp.]